MQGEIEKESGVVSLAIVDDSISLKSSSSLKSIFNERNSFNRSNNKVNPLEDSLHYETCIEGISTNIINDIKISDPKVINFNVPLRNNEEANGNEVERWLPITESRKGNVYFCIFHLISSGLAIQSLALPMAFATLGWAWGIIWMSLAFIWQLYTIWLLTQLHESSGSRISRYLQLAMAAFGQKLGKLLALFPVMYLSGGTCVTLLITGGGAMQNFYHILCEYSHKCDPNAVTTIEWYLIFICLAIIIAQLPNLNSMAWVSLVGAITAIVYWTLIWVLSIIYGRSHGTAYRSDPVRGPESKVRSVMDVLFAIGTVALSFRGHNLVLEIQGTLPPSLKFQTHKTMWKGVKVSYALISMCMFPFAIGGYWAYGKNLMSAKGIIATLAQIQGNHGSKLKLAIIYFFLIINCICSFQVYAMPVFDNLEFRYVSIKKKHCTWWLRAGLRVFFGGLVFFIGVTFPFLPMLAPLIGGISLLPITLSYPCFMWIFIKKPKKFGAMWFINLVLGSLGILLSVLVIVAAIYNLVTRGVHANFFHPKP